MASTLKHIAQRLALGVATLVVVSMVIFMSVELLPGDIAQEILGQAATPESVAALRQELGLNTPPLTRYLAWLSDIARGDLGTSLANKRPVAELIGARLGNTMFLAAVSALIAVPLSLLLGVLTALYRNSFFDRAINAVTISLISFPDFFVAYLLIFFFAINIGVFPAISNISASIDFSERLWRSILPATTLTIGVTAHMMRMTRASIINLLAQPYIEMARIKGASPSRVVIVHALRNAVAPIVNVIALNLAFLITGVVVVEVVFVYPGLGQLLVDSVAKRDIIVVQAACLVFSVTYVLINLIADIISIVSNPRLMHAR